MRPAYRYPVDRYLVESSKKMEMVNIVDDEDLWEPEPAIKPEDEIILRKLHSMLQSTADDLKLLSGELSKYHHQQEMVQVKSRPTPLDDEFNEKVHIEELVNAKFHGFTVVDNNLKQVNAKNFMDRLKVAPKNLIKPKSNVGTQLNQVPSKKTVSRKLEITPVRITGIDENVNKTKNTINDELNKTIVLNKKPKVVYNEFSYEYVKSKAENITRNQLQRQDMPSINIRSELREQKVLQLDIMPENKNEMKNQPCHKSNVAVIVAEHATAQKLSQKTSVPIKNTYKHSHTVTINQNPIRKMTKISTGDSSMSSNNISSEAKTYVESNDNHEHSTKTSPKLSARTKNKKGVCRKGKGLEKKIHFDLNEWKQKLKSVYGQHSTSKKSKASAKVQSRDKSKLPSSLRNAQAKLLNNSEYIPYSKLTLGGAKVSDVEREISDLTNKDIPLSPILDKILSSQENTPRKKENRNDPKVLTTSDENLLEEVLDLERTVSQTLSVNLIKQSKALEKSGDNVSNKASEVDDKDSYADDFEEENSANSKTSSCSHSDRKTNSNTEITDAEDPKPDTKSEKVKLNKTYTKVHSLAIKKPVDIFEFIHSVDTHDTATQSNTANKISLKETQTSPKNDRPNMQSVHNELWPSIDPNKEVENMFQLEKEFIKKVILDEYGDFITKNLEKPSTSQDNNLVGVNIKAIQKNTQTSPAHVKCVMTSPAKTKSSTTSPFISVKDDKDTSPFVVVTNEEELKVKVGIGKEEDAISINLSSPRFNLHLPSTSREAVSNLDASRNKSENKEEKTKCRTYQKRNISSSSSAEGDYSSSELSSLGEVNIRKLLRKNRKLLNISESSSATSVSKYSSDSNSGGIIPLRSEGEVTNSLGQTNKNNKTSKSEGEISSKAKR